MRTSKSVIRHNYPINFTRDQSSEQLFVGHMMYTLDPNMKQDITGNCENFMEYRVYKRAQYVGLFLEVTRWRFCQAFIINIKLIERIINEIKFID